MRGAEEEEDSDGSALLMTVFSIMGQAFDQPSVAPLFAFAQV